LDGEGNLYITDPGNSRIRKVTPDGTITTVAGNGMIGYSGDGGPATAASLSSPHELVLDSAGDLFIGDKAACVVRKVATNGIITTVAGTDVFGYSGDGGPATNARLSLPTGLSFNASGNLYIADQGNNRIRALLTNGTISLVAGNGNAGYSGDGGPAPNAALYAPRSVAIVAGYVYVADSGNERVLLLTPIEANAPNITPGGIVPIYSSANTIQPGSCISIFGTNLAAAPATWTGNFPTSLGNTSVTIDGQAAYLWYVSPTQINLQAPDDTATGTVNVVVTTASGSVTSSRLRKK
jgi:hypothetical protein